MGIGCTTCCFHGNIHTVLLWTTVYSNKLIHIHTIHSLWPQDFSNRILVYQFARTINITTSCLTVHYYIYHLLFPWQHTYQQQCQLTRLHNSLATGYTVQIFLPLHSRDTILCTVTILLTSAKLDRMDSRLVEAHLFKPEWGWSGVLCDKGDSEVEGLGKCVMGGALRQRLG